MDPCNQQRHGWGKAILCAELLPPRKHLHKAGSRALGCCSGCFFPLLSHVLCKQTQGLCLLPEGLVLQLSWQGGR